LLIVVDVGIYVTVLLRHTTHNPATDMDAIGLSVHPLVKAKIIQLVNDGVNKVAFSTMLLRETDTIVQQLGVTVQGRVDTRFYPTDQTIRNLRAQALKAWRLNTIDQEAVRMMMEQCQAKNPRDTFVFRPYKRGGESKMLAFIQTADQKRMLRRYVCMSCFTRGPHVLNR
jgi:hypothetical protein